MPRRKCMVWSCTGQPKNSSGFLCPSCWFKVPKPIRDRVWDTYKNARGSADHGQAIRDAVRAARPEGELL